MVKKSARQSKMRSALPQAGLVPPQWQVLTPRTRISNPALGPFVLPRSHPIRHPPRGFKRELFTVYSPGTVRGPLAPLACSGTTNGRCQGEFRGGETK